MRLGRFPALSLFTLRRYSRFTEDLYSFGIATKFIMKPRIYTYRITFEEVPHWYWGAHKEKFYKDGYLGSPITHRWMWEFYSPKIQILEVFPYTDSGWKECLSVERRLIRPDLNNPLCLNENCGGSFSLEGSKGLQRWRDANEDKLIESALHAHNKMQEWRTKNPVKDQERIEKFVSARRKWLNSEESEEYRKSASARTRERNHRRFRCKISGKIANAGNLTQIQRKLGIDPVPENREEVRG